jgi:hypothetical protein
MNEPPGSEGASAIGRHEIKIVDASIAESRLLPGCVSDTPWSARLQALA